MSSGETAGKPFLVMSDARLGEVPAATERAFRGFLEHAAAHVAGLLINGDLFDVWFAPHGYPAYRKRHPVLRHRAFRWAAQRVAHVDRIYDRIAAWSVTRDFVQRHTRGEGTGPKPLAEPIEA